MSFKDKLKSATNKALDITKETVNNEIKKNIEIKEHNRMIASKKEQFNRLTKTKLNLTSGAKLINKPSNITMYQKENGEIFFDLDDDKTYRLLEYTWAGPKFKTMTSSETLSEEQKKGKAGKVIVGGLIGSLVAVPTAGVSTIVGAGAGALSKGKKNIKSNTKTVSEEVEINTPGSLKLQCVENNQIIGLGIVCNSYIDTEIRKFAFASDIKNIIDDKCSEVAFEDVCLSANDPYEEIKKAKELFDIGILSQEEFDKKKKELLGL